MSKIYKYIIELLIKKYIKIKYFNLVNIISSKMMSNIKNIKVTKYADYEYQLQTSNSEFNLIIKPSDKYISFKLKKEMILGSYEAIFTLQDFQDKSKVFYLYDSLNEITELLKEKIESEDFYIKESEKICIFVFSFIFQGKTHCADLQLNVIENNELTHKHCMEAIGELLKKIKNLENRVQILENEVIEKKTKLFKDSLIISTIEEEKLLKTWLKEKNNKETKNAKLLYSSSRDGFTSEAFHLKCDGKRSTLTIIQSQNHSVFGGFTNLAWDKSGNYKTNDNTAFLFSLDKKRKFDCINQSYVIYCGSDNLATFGGGHDICVQYNSCYSSLGHSYGNNQNDFNAYFLINSNNSNFQLKEMEVYLVEF